MVVHREPLDQHAPEIAGIITDLHSRGRLRVWSIIVSIFGDAVQPRREDIAAADLQSILACLGIDAGAMRTAVSRLSRDGWIDRARSGRTSRYRLTDKARREADAAGPGFYAPVRPAMAGAPWIVVWSERAAPPDLPGLQLIGRAIGVIAGHPTAKPDVLALPLRSTSLPNWAREALASGTLLAEMSTLMTGFAPLQQEIAGGAVMRPEMAVALRALLIHDWRRIVLRHPDVPDDLLPGDWPEQATRAFVRDLHKRLTVLAEPWLDAALPLRKNDMLQTRD